MERNNKASPLVRANFAAYLRFRLSSLLSSSILFRETYVYRITWSERGFYPLIRTSPPSALTKKAWEDAKDYAEFAPAKTAR